MSAQLHVQGTDIFHDVLVVVVVNLLIAEGLRPFAFGEVLDKQTRTIVMGLIAKGVVDRGMFREDASLAGKVLEHNRVAEIGTQYRRAGKRLKYRGGQQTMHLQGMHLAP